jgi:hypothetical protein
LDRGNKFVGKLEQFFQPVEAERQKEAASITDLVQRQ